MKYILDELYAFRFYENKDGPFVSIRQFSDNEVTKIGQDAGIINIHEIYRNRVIIEDLLYRMFKRQGGNPKRTYPYYATVFDKLPKNNQLHVRFQQPECIRIPMSEFPKDQISFTYGQSPRALTRKDNHPTRRKLLLWDEAEWAINKFPYIEDEGTWLEMQIWEDDTLTKFYDNGHGKSIREFVVAERLSDKEREELKEKYAPLIKLIKPEYFFSPTSAHGVSHAIRVLVLAQIIAQKCMLTSNDLDILAYAAAYHDIGRENHKVDVKHGFASFKKIVDLKLCPGSFTETETELFRFAVENHQLSVSEAMENLKQYKISDTERAYELLTILKDADTLERCRFGNVDISYIYHDVAKKMVNLGYQLLTIYPEMINL